MTSIHDVDATELIEKLAEELKKIEHIKPPAWAIFVKTGMSKERPPMKKDWWYTRAASILRYVRIRGPIGVHKLRIKYGSKKNRGVAAEHFYKASGNIIRKILQQLEKAELVKKGDEGVHKGRVITPKGIKLMNIAVKSSSKVKKTEKKVDVVKEITKKAEKPKEEKKEAPKELSNESEKGLEKSKTSQKEKKAVEKPKESPKVEAKKEEEAKPMEKKEEKQKEAPKEPKPEEKKNG